MGAAAGIGVSLMGADGAAMGVAGARPADEPPRFAVRFADFLAGPFLAAAFFAGDVRAAPFLAGARRDAAFFAVCFVACFVAFRALLPADFLAAPFFAVFLAVRLAVRLAPFFAVAFLAVRLAPFFAVVFLAAFLAVFFFAAIAAPMGAGVSTAWVTPPRPIGPRERGCHSIHTRHAAVRNRRMHDTPRDAHQPEFVPYTPALGAR